MNLIICTTPFQMLIAEKVIEKNQCDIFHLVVFSSTWNDKYQHYMEKLLSHKNVIFLKKYVVCKDKQFSRLCQLILVRILSLFLRGNVNKVYVASIDSIWVRLFLSSLDKFNLYTFDDGTANIFKNSFFYKDDSFLMKFIMKLLCSRYTMLDLKRMSLEHYTIYKNRENIVESEKLTYISLYEYTNKVNDKPTQSKKRIKLLLGQPIESIFKSIDDGVNAVRKIFELFNINYYYPHPRERFAINDINYIKSELIFEDYFISHFMPDTEYTIYTFYSGAVLSFINLPNIKIISIKPNICKDEISQDFYIMKLFGIEVIEYTHQ